MVDFIKIEEENSDKEKPKKKAVKRTLNWKGIFMIMLFIFIISSIISSVTYSLSPKIAVVPISGSIMTEKTSSILGSESKSSREIANILREIQADSSIKAVILDINSPGGSAVASEEISKAIEELKKEKPVYALINDVGASGAFWIAVSTDKVYASSMSTLGSIGVTSAGLGFEELIKEYNITYRRLVAGDKKDMGSPFREQTEEENQIIQEILDEVHVYFIEHIANSRNMSYDYVKTYATGEIFLGKKAKELGFIDEIGYYPQVLEELKSITGLKDPIIITYTSPPTLIEILGVDAIFKESSTRSEILLK